MENNELKFAVVRDVVEIGRRAKTLCFELSPELADGTEHAFRVRIDDRAGYFSATARAGLIEINEDEIAWSTN